MRLPNPTEIKPWGAYQNLFESEGFLVKILVVDPGNRLSLQRHFKRQEHWVIVSGRGVFEVGNMLHPLGPGDMLAVDMYETHRMTNDGDEPLVVLELQKGICEEIDIERIEDDYRRS